VKVVREFERDGGTVVVSAEHVGGDRWRVRVGDRVYDYDARSLGAGGVRLQRIGSGDGGTDDVVSVAFGAGGRKKFRVRVDGRTFALAAPAGRRGGGAAAADGTVRAPMTGTELAVRCQPGDAVAADQTLVVVSAMKMEHKLTAGVAGVVRSVETTANATVEQGDVLVVVEPEEANA
jgi:acetyl-CoA/propionyl-CoA carboxylase biotin carboxyl carrier protein